MNTAKEDNNTRKYIEVRCGKCAACLRTKRRVISYRLQQELKDWTTAIFLTLTYECPLCLHQGVSKRHIQLFLKRLRKSLGSRKIRYYCIAEYGGKIGRPHYHLIIFGMSNSDYDIIDKSWKFGFIKIGSVTAQSINYVTKHHVLPKTHAEGKKPTFTLFSRKPMLGYRYVLKMLTWHLSCRDRYYMPLHGQKFPLHAGYRKHLEQQGVKFNIQIPQSLDKPLTVRDYELLEDQRNIYLKSLIKNK